MGDAIRLRERLDMIAPLHGGERRPAASQPEQRRRKSGEIAAQHRRAVMGGIDGHEQRLDARGRGAELRQGRGHGGKGGRADIRAMRIAEIEEHEPATKALIIDRMAVHIGQSEGAADAAATCFATGGALQAEEEADREDKDEQQAPAQYKNGPHRDGTRHIRGPTAHKGVDRATKLSHVLVMFLFEPEPHEGRGMARIRKEDHARILHLVDVERRPVREIAADFGCTSAAIYSLLAKLRREGDKTAAVADEADQMTAKESLLPPEQPGLSLDAEALMVQPGTAVPAERALPVAQPDAVREDAAGDGASLRAAPQIIAFENSCGLGVTA